MNKIIIDVRGGIVQGVYSDSPQDIIIVDHDNLSKGDVLDGPYSVDGTIEDYMSEVDPDLIKSLIAMFS